MARKSSHAQAPHWRIGFNQWRRLRRRSYFAQQHGQLEVCGMFAVDRRGEISLVFLKNLCDRPCCFELDATILKAKRKDARQRGLRITGIFHSHPISEPIPGSRDISNSAANENHLIYDVCGSNAKAWRIRVSGAKKIPVEIPLKITRTNRR